VERSLVYTVWRDIQREEITIPRPKSVNGWLSPGSYWKIGQRLCKTARCRSSRMNDEWHSLRASDSLQNETKYAGHSSVDVYRFVDIVTNDELIAYSSGCPLYRLFQTTVGYCTESIQHSLAHDNVLALGSVTDRLLLMSLSWKRRMMTPRCDAGRWVSACVCVCVKHETHTYSFSFLPAGAPRTRWYHRH